MANKEKPKKPRRRLQTLAEGFGKFTLKRLALGDGKSKLLIEFEIEDAKGKTNN